jgi:HD-GYP domain-containing protein (c-di-GMP phosphodiesterase class II)
LSVCIAVRLDCDAEGLRLAAQTGLLHDVGKLYTPREVLRKPAPLEADERAMMNRHADEGADLVQGIPSLRHLAPAVRACQEHFDGSGYPDGLRGERIPLVARIVSVADAFHAMRSDRPYRTAMPRAAAAAELVLHAGRQFDPDVVAVLLALIGRRRPRQGG